MAAAGSAHLTGTADASRPSVFEVLSHESFGSALKPAVFHVVKVERERGLIALNQMLLIFNVLAEKNPAGWAATTYRYFDELYLAFDAIVQWHYMLTRGATLSEAFYGLERKWPSPENKYARVKLSYLVSVLLPYLSSKLDSLSKSELEPEYEAGESQIVGKKEDKQTEKQRLMKACLQLYPYIKLSLRVANMSYLLAYTFGRSEHHNLTFKLLRMTLNYASEERSKFMEEKNAELWMASEWRDPRKLPKLILRSLGESVLFGVEIATFFIQFLEWWNNDDKRARITVNSLPAPPAPQAGKENRNIQNFVKLLPSDMNKCPLCRKEFRNPTVVSVSGVVYCYGCIFPRLNAQIGVCPLTNLPCNINHLIRIYNN